MTIIAVTQLGLKITYGPGRSTGYPSAPPTDPYVKVSLIQVGYDYLGEQTLPRAGLAPAGNTALWAADPQGNNSKFHEISLIPSASDLTRHDIGKFLGVA